MLEQSGLQAVALWAGLHLATTLVLALNVVRRRLGQDPDPDGPLHKAVRAHGNNIEYVPIILLGQVVLALLGTNTVVIHAALGSLWLARLCHAWGIQQPKTPHPAGVIGNLVTWTVMLLTAGLLLIEAFT